MARDHDDLFTNLGLNSSLLRTIRSAEAIARQVNGLAGLTTSLASAQRAAVGLQPQLLGMLPRDVGMARLLHEQRQTTGMETWHELVGSLGLEGVRQGTLAQLMLGSSSWKSPLDDMIHSTLARQQSALAASGASRFGSLIEELTRPTRVVGAFLAETLAQAESVQSEARDKLLVSIAQAESDLDEYSGVITTTDEFDVADAGDPPPVIITSPFVFRDELVRNDEAAIQVAKTVVIARQIVAMRQSLNEFSSAGECRKLFDTTTHTETAIAGLFWLAPSNREELATLVDYLYILFYESAGTDKLRYLKEHGGVLTDDACEVVWLLKALRNKGFRHDPEHGSPREVVKKRRQFLDTLVDLGCRTMPCKPADFRMVQTRLLERIHSFLENLIAAQTLQ